MATALLKDDAPNRVPMFISAQELARLMRGIGASARAGNLFHMYINSLNNNRKGAKEMLLDAYTNRTAILILDGLVSFVMLRSLLELFPEKVKYNYI